MANLATLMVGLGYDLSALEKGAPEAFRLINSQTMGMSAEMKRTSREGAESFRLIDEALGIHVSRPLTRILTQEFPAFASALQSIIGVGIVGALGVALFEGFEHAARSIENAQKAQEEFAKSTEKTKTVFEDAMASYEKADKLRSLSGLSLDLFKIDSASIDEARKHIDELAASFAEMAKKQEVASNLWERFKAFVGDSAHTLTSKPTDLAAERIGKQMEDFQGEFDRLSKEDALKGTKESATYVHDKLAAASTLLEKMTSHRMTGFETFLRNQMPVRQTGEQGYSDAEISKMREYVDLLKKANDLLAAAGKHQGGQDDDARAAAALAARKAAIADLQGDLKGYNEEVNKGWVAWMKTNEELDKLIPKLGETALPAAASRFSEFQNVYGKQQVAPPPGAPQLNDQAELEKVQSDQNEAYSKAGEILNQIESPLQKYTTQLTMLKTLLSDGRINTQQFAAAQQQLQNELVKSENHIEEMQRALENLLKKSDSAKAGMQAFMMQLNIDASRNGTFTFDLLNKGLQGFEDETVKALTGAKTNWQSFFESLDQMALKFFLNKLMQQLMNGLQGNGFLSSLFGGGGGGVGAGTGGAGVIGDLSDSGISGYAGGTDYAPGGMAWVGENGPELLNLPRGSSVTPSAAVRGGDGMTVHIDARGGEIGVEEKIARAFTMMTPRIVRQAVVNANEIQSRTPTKR